MSNPGPISFSIITFLIAINLILPLCILIGCIDGLDEEKACMPQHCIQAAALQHSSAAYKEPASSAIEGVLLKRRIHAGGPQHVNEKRQGAKKN